MKLQLILSFALLSCCFTLAQTRPPDLQDLDALASILDAGKIGRTEVLSIPLEATATIEITPAALEKGWWHKTTIRNINTLSGEQLVRAVRAGRTQPVEGPIDLRYGVIFYSSADDVRVASIMFDSSGSRGYFGGKAVTFNVGFFVRFREAINLSILW